MNPDGRHNESRLSVRQPSSSVPVLVINAGSSSLKFALYDMSDERLCLSGNIERIGTTSATAAFFRHTDDGQIEEEAGHTQLTDHAAALQQTTAYLVRHIGSLRSLAAIGHRVVHGGACFSSAVFIDDEVIGKIRDAIPRAPLHNPANLAGIEVLRELTPETPQVAVFDTAFFHTLPSHAYRYAVPQQWYRDFHVRRYGFHGTSHQYVATAAAGYLRQSLQHLRLISLHLGNGASAAAIEHGKCIDTSMGMTPLEGLIMGTRCGDIDPALPFYLASHHAIDLDKIDSMLNQDSGLMGLCGAHDMRDVQRLAASGDEQAALAIDAYCYRISKYIGAYHVALGGLDALLFTAGVGENDPCIRRRVCKQLGILGVEIDDDKNEHCDTDIFDISTANSAVRVLVVKTNEALEIARQTLQHSCRHACPVAAEETSK